MRAFTDPNIPENATCVETEILSKHFTLQMFSAGIAWNLKREGRFLPLPPLHNTDLKPCR